VRARLRLGIFFNFLIAGNLPNTFIKDEKVIWGVYLDFIDVDVVFSK